MVSNMEWMLRFTALCFTYYSALQGEGILCFQGIIFLHLYRERREKDWRYVYLPITVLAAQLWPWAGFIICHHFVGNLGVVFVLELCRMTHITIAMQALAKEHGVGLPGPIR